MDVQSLPRDHSAAAYNERLQAEQPHPKLPTQPCRTVQTNATYVLPEPGAAQCCRSDESQEPPGRYLRFTESASGLCRKVEKEKAPSRAPRRKRGASVVSGGELVLRLAESGGLTGMLPPQFRRHCLASHNVLMELHKRHHDIYMVRRTTRVASRGSLCSRRTQSYQVLLAGN